MLPRDRLQQAGKQDLVGNWVMAACVVRYTGKRLVSRLLRRMFACMSWYFPCGKSTPMWCHPQGGPAGDLQPESRTQGDSASSSGAPAPAGAMADNPKSLPYPPRRRRAATRRLRRTLPWGNPTLVHGRRRPPTAMRRAAGRGKRRGGSRQGTGTRGSGGEIGTRTRARAGATPGARAMATRTATSVAGAQAKQGRVVVH